MAVFPGWEQPEDPDELAPSPEELFAHIEGLAGEEIALLDIPAHERSDGQRARLKHVTKHLDQLWDRLRRRAAELERRLGRKSQ